MLVTLIVILSAALFVMTWGDDGDQEDVATATTTTTSLASVTTSTAAPTTIAPTTTTTIPVECGTEGPAGDGSTTTSTTEAPTEDESTDAGSDTTTSLSPSLGPNDSVSTVGFGEVDFGMTVRQAETAAGTRMIPCGPIGACYRVIPEVAPEGISFLVTDGTIERLDVVAGRVTTRSGVGIGTEQDRIIELFGDRIETAINDDSSVDLIFVPQDEQDAQFRVIFTVRDGIVETFRSGRLAQVTVPNPCAEAA